MANKKSGIIWKIALFLSIIVAVFGGGYLFLDKMVVPKYFAQYGINGVPDLVGVVTSLYKSPNEKKLVTNGYTQNDITSAITILQDANYKIADDGTIDNSALFKGDKSVKLTDREFAGICNKLIENGILVDVLPNLNYVNLLNISILEVNILPNEDLATDGGYSGANISFIAKIDTVDIREQIAAQMDTPLFLLNMIIPDSLYFSVSYDIDLSKSESERVSDGTISINGRTAKQSQILIDLLIDFIFPAEDNMDLKKFTDTLGNIVLEGIDILGDFKFINDIEKNGVMFNGLLVTPV